MNLVSRIERERARLEGQKRALAGNSFHAVASDLRKKLCLSGGRPAWVFLEKELK